METREQLAFLRDHGCRNIQGFLFCAPLPVDEFTDYMTINAEAVSRQNSTITGIFRLKDAIGP